MEVYTLSGITSGIIAHQVNCLGYMGCGAALAIRRRWPEAYERYRVFGHRTGNGRWQLGMCQIVQVTPELAVANLAGQFGISRQRRMTDYRALDQALAKLASRRADRPVYFPVNMGSRNAGGDWAVILPMITKRFSDARFFTRGVHGE
jgi:O-acetyl-ADP-ribose deacetylase (regulator of RNase III)